MKELQAIVYNLLESASGPSVLATLVAVEGSSYRRPGARLLVLPDGSRIGSISGGCLEEDVLARARRVAGNGIPDTVIYDTTSENDLVWGVGLGCHGVVRVFLERLSPRPAWAQQLADNFAARRPTRLAVTHENSDPAQLGTSIADPATANGAGTFVQTVAPPTMLHIFGAGDDAQPLVRLAKELGWVVTVNDPRPAHGTHERFPTADAVITGPVEELAAAHVFDCDSLAVVMTHHYVHDVPLLRELLPQPLAYLGLLGPRKRAEKILADLTAAGIDITPEQRARLHAPVGLDIGADGPEQVALAIVAEIQASLAGRSSRPLRERLEPIHRSGSDGIA
ncbi:MAG TPA: XdhC family protein [Opitutaceae bacterium]|nr:XdhC family protein [Opitutaceae bacterium]